MFYQYRQNNTGGSFEYDFEKGISIVVIIEADDAEYADFLAQRAGLYFDGCETGGDCPCCGDRWSSVSNWGGEDGTEVPTHYATKIDGEPVEPGSPASVFVHRKDGSVQGFMTGESMTDGWVERRVERGY